MKLTDGQIKQIEKFALGYYRKLDTTHNIEHAERTVKLAEYLAKKEKADVQICKLGALLHQFHDGKKVDKFLRKIRLDDDMRKQLVHCVECSATKNVHKAETTEAKIVYDADKLQCIGSFGILRELAFRKMPFREGIKFVRRHEKRIFKNFQTKTARKLAKEPHRLVIKFFKIFDKQDKVII